MGVGSTMDKIEYVEKQVERLATFRLETMELLNKRAHTLVTWLFGGASALGAYFVSLLERGSPPWMASAALGAALWLFWVAAVTARRCLMTGLMLPPGEEPEPMLDYSGSLEEIRQVNARRLGARTRAWASTNTQCGTWLNYCYLAAACTPIVGAVAAGLAAARHAFQG